MVKSPGQVRTQTASTEGLILEAAKKVFIKKGREGARMQEIADEAGINKALLHYYFRSKDRLFEAVFREVLASFFPSVGSLMEDQSVPLFEKIEVFVEKYIHLLIENPFLPGFIVHELSREQSRPEFILGIFAEAGVSPGPFFDQVRREADQGIIGKVDPLHLLVNMISLCVFPFISRPLVSHILLDDPSGYDRFLLERKKEIPRFIIQSIRNK